MCYTTLMLRRFVLVPAFLAASFLPAAAQDAPPPYRDARLPIAQRVQDLLGRMTLEEKVAQLAPQPGAPHAIDVTGKFTEETAAAALARMFDNRSTVSVRDAAILRNAVQRYLLTKTRLGIPTFFWGEALHGFMFHGATSFPQALGLAGTWDPALIEQVFTAAADEMASTGVHQAFTPVLDLARDPRWGRTEETYGEDPYLAARIGVAAIRGMQGPNYLIDRRHVLATAKHFAVHGQPESGTNTAPGNYSERIIRESFLVPFEAAITEARAGSVMASYNEIDGVPSHVNPWLLDQVLRREWGFDGYVISDGGGLPMLLETHRIAKDKEGVARQALSAGVDYDLSDGSIYRTIVEQVKQGRIPQAQVDLAAGRVLAAKFRLGLFENPYVDPDYAGKITNSAAHRALAQKTAERAITLLKNEGGLLPLDPAKVKTIAVIGPNASDVHLGGYSREPAHGVSLLEGVRERAGKSGVKVLFSEGCKITEGVQGWYAWYEDAANIPSLEAQRKSIAAAVDATRAADVAILIVGENESTNREAWNEQHLGDRDSLDLIGAQNELVRAVVETGKPTVVFLINGRPLSINYAAERAQAILEGWYLGQEGGTAAARVLFGDVNPGGKLPITFPRSVGQIPAYYNHKPSMNRSYLNQPGRKPLYPFGWGLSYTTFKFENLKVEPAVIGAAGETTVSVDVVNTGAREGDEVAQLYIHQKVASVTRPVKELRGFERVTLKPGERRTVRFRLGPRDLEMLNREMRRVVEPGEFEIMAGPNSVDLLTATLTVEAR